MINDFLYFILHFIFISYGVYSVFYFLTRLFFKNEFFKQFDRSATRLTAISGMVYFAGWLIWLLIISTENVPVEYGSGLERRVREAHGWLYLQPCLTLVSSQLLWVKNISRFLLFRIIFSVLMTLPIVFERFVIIATSLERDYIPSSWQYSISYIELLAGLILNTIVFLLITFLYWQIALKIKKRYGYDS